MPKIDNILKQAERLAQEVPARFPSGFSFHRMLRGMHERKRSGSGDYFWQFRDYQTGDSLRQVDWKKSAKSDRLLTREQEESVPQNVFFYREMARSMDYASRARGVSKKDYADVIWLSLSYMAVKAGEHIAVAGMPQFRAAHAEKIPSLYREMSSSSFDGFSDSDKNGHIIVLSDFCQPVDHIASFLSGLASRSLTAQIIYISDPAEIDFPFSGHVVLEDNRLSLEIPAAQSMQSIYREKFAQHKEAIRQLALAQGFDFLHIVTDKPLAETLSLVLQQMERG